MDSTAFLSPQYLTLATNSNLSNERVLVAGSGLTLTDGGAGGNATLAVGAGTLLTVAADSVGITPGANYQFIGTGGGTAAGWRNVSELAGAGLAAATGVLAVGAGNGISVAADSVAVNQAYGFTWTAQHTFQADIQLDADLDFVGAQSITTTAGNLTISPAGDVVFDPTGNDLLPASNYDLNIGSLSKKYLTLHAAELWVETLVAQDTIATIGGRILVGPTTTLIADLAPAGTTIDVKHNQLASGDRVYMEANGAVEFMAVTSGPTTITGGYRYSVTRNLDGTGANQWYAGDAVFNTGTTGDGFIDIYSVQSMKPGMTQAGPSIVGNVRNSATYNDWSEHWAVGNLNGVYGYGVDTYGAAFGKYASGQPWVGVDATNGFRIMNYNTVVGQWATNGDWQISGNGQNYIGWDASEGTLTVEGTIAVSQSVGAGGGNDNLEGGGLITVSDWGMIQMGTDSVFQMGADSTFTAGAGSTFTIGTQGSGAYLSYANGELVIEGMLAVTDGEDFLPAHYRPAAISASFDVDTSNPEATYIVAGAPYGETLNIAGKLEMANGDQFYLYTGSLSIITNASRYYKLTVTKTSSAPFYGSIDLPATEGSYSNVLYVSVYEDGQWAALSQATKDNRVIIADAYLSTGFDEILTLTMRAESAMSIIGPDFIRTDNLAAISANLGSVTAGSIVVGSSNKLWLNDDASEPTIALAVGGTTKGSAPFRLYENGVFRVGGASDNYVHWSGSALTVKGTMHADAGYLGGLTVDGNLTMNGGKIQWNSTNSYIDNNKILIKDASGYSTTLIGDSAYPNGVINITLDAGGNGGWPYGVRVVDGGNTQANVTALYRGSSGIAGATAVDRIFSAYTWNGSYSDSFYAENAAFGGWDNFNTAGVPFKGIHNAGGPVALFNQLGGGADAPVVWATSQNTNRSLVISEMGANGQQGFRVIRNGYGSDAGSPAVALNADSSGVEYVRYQRFVNLATNTAGAGDAGVPAASSTSEFIIYARQGALRIKNSQYEWNISTNSATALP